MVEMENLPFQEEDARTKSLPTIGERIWYLQWKQDVRNHSSSDEVFIVGTDGVFYPDIPDNEQKEAAKLASLLSRYKRAARELSKALSIEAPLVTKQDLQNKTMVTPMQVGRHPWERDSK
jgi:hypothetical protein